MASSNEFSILSKIAIGKQNHIDYENMKHHPRPNVFLYSKIETNNLYDNNYMKKLVIVDKRNIYFNCLELKFFNPLKKSFNEIFERITFEIQNKKIISFDNEEFLIIIQKLMDLKPTRQEDEYTVIPLPFLLKDNIMYNTEWNHISIKLQMKSFISQPELYGNLYKRTHPINKLNLRAIKAIENDSGKKIENNETYETINNRIIQLQSFKEILNDNTPFSSIKLDFKNLSNMIYFKGDVSKIETIQLSITNVLTRNFSVNELIELNKNNGYDFDFPVIIFEPKFFKKDSCAINMSRIDEIRLMVWYNIGAKELSIYNVNINTLITENGENRVGFC